MTTYTTVELLLDMS